MSEPTPSRVRLLRDVITEVGIFHAGLPMMATRTEDGWLLHVSLPGRAPMHLEPIPPEAARYYGKHTARMDSRKRAAHEDYQFATTLLRYDNDQAVRWLKARYDVSLKTLREWGFRTGHLETIERAAREAT
jgi:hypothetical protein